MKLNCKTAIFIVVLVMLIFGIFAFQPSLKAKNIQAPPIEITDFLSKATLGKSKTYKNITIFPVISSKQDLPTLISLDEGLKQELIEIKEVGSGNVNTLLLTKRTTEKPIFIMAGEIVKGAKQDRIISNDLLLGKSSGEYKINVYCVEQGRWNKQSEKFDSSGLVGSGKLRSELAQKSSQSSVWNEVSKKNVSMGASSDTQNYSASYESKLYKDNSSEFFEALYPVASENNNFTGVIVQIDNNITNLDIFSDHKTFKSLWPKLLKAYIQDCLSNNKDSNLKAYTNPHELLALLIKTQYFEVPNPGLGNEFTLKERSYTGNILTYTHSVLHIATFLDEGNTTTYKYPIPQIQEVPNILRPRR